MSELLDGKVAIVTGGTSGIGLATALRFVASGAKVTIADIQDDLGEKIAAEHPDSILYVHTDVTDEAAIENVVAKTVERFGKLDVMFNNAGAQGDPSAILDVTAEGFQKTVALLTTSVLLGHKYAARQWPRARADQSSAPRAPPRCRAAGVPRDTRSRSTPSWASCARPSPSSRRLASARTPSHPGSS